MAVQAHRREREARDGRPRRAGAAQMVFIGRRRVPGDRPRVEHREAAAAHVVRHSPGENDLSSVPHGLVDEQDVTVAPVLADQPAPPVQTAQPRREPDVVRERRVQRALRSRPDDEETVSDPRRAVGPRAESNVPRRPVGEPQVPVRLVAEQARLVAPLSRQAHERLGPSVAVDVDDTDHRAAPHRFGRGRGRPGRRPQVVPEQQPPVVVEDGEDAVRESPRGGRAPPGCRRRRRRLEPADGDGGERRSRDAPDHPRADPSDGG